MVDSTRVPTATVQPLPPAQNTGLVKARQESVPGRLDAMTSWMELTILGLRDNQLKTNPRGSLLVADPIQAIFLFNNPWDCARSRGLRLSRWLEPNSGNALSASSAQCPGSVVNLSSEE
ncbi:unnamed protein product [Lampetra planeri]